MVKSSATRSCKNMSDKSIKNSRQKWVLPVVLLILLVLLLFTTFLLVHRLGEFAANELNAIFLVQPEPKFIVEDEDQIWGTETRIDLFKTDYSGIGRDITVESSNGDRLIAPGTEGEYTFTLKNSGNVALDYRVSMDAELYIEGNTIALDQFPLGIRLRHYSGEYLLGDGETWISVAELEDYITEDTLAINHYAWYTIEWKWLFEENTVDDHDRLQLNVGDELDTLLGNITAETPITLSVAISTEAEPSEDAVAKGGIVQLMNADGTIVGWFPWILLLLLIAVALTATAFGYSCHSRKKDKPSQADSSEDLTGVESGSGNASE